MKTAACLLIALAGARAVAAAPAPPSPASLLAFLDEAVAWYRQQVAQAQLATEPSDVVFADAARQQARRALALAFEYARAEVALIPTAAARQDPAAARDDQGADAVRQRAAAADDAVQQAQGRVDALQRAAAAPRRADRLLPNRIREARAELALARARRDALQTLASFAAQTGYGGQGPSGLLGQIQELQQSVPEIAAGAAGAAGTPRAPPGASAEAVARRAAPTGIVSLAGDVLSLSRKLRQVSAGEKLTAALREAVERQRTPLLASLRATLQQADQASAPGAGAAAALQQRTQAVDRATARVKEIAAALVPIAKEAVLLDAHRATLSEWHGAIDEQSAAQLRRLALHLALLAIAVAAILAASGAWRRATFRYVRDPRRRRRSLLLRRIAVAAAIVLVLIFSFVAELGSVATLAGFITAGLAVALQNVILSVAAYFFLIGRYGIGVGDRVQISGVSGDVIDIGLVRVHLMELRGDGQPTGRVVVFSNAVLFQPAANFFKQMPGSSFTWHELKLTVSADGDYRRAEERMLDAVGRVYAPYREQIERQHHAMAAQLAPIPVHPPSPRSQLQLTGAGLEMTIRFPVPLDRASAVDDEVTRALLEAIAREPRLRLVGSGTPTVQAVPDPAHA